MNCGNNTAGFHLRTISAGIESLRFNALSYFAHITMAEFYTIFPAAGTVYH
jgi:hypothetical protein